MSHDLICLTSRLISVAAVGLLLGTTSGCLVATGTESEADLGEVASPVIGGTAATQNQIFSAVARLRCWRRVILTTFVAGSSSLPRWS